MRWNSKAKPEPCLGDRRERTAFAVFPTRVEDKWIWLEKFIKVFEYKEYLEAYEEDSSYDLLLTEHVTIGYRRAIGWRVVDKKLLG